MGCSKCGRPAVVFQDYSGLGLCKQHFKEDVHHKAKRAVRQHHWLVPGQRYAIALSGGPSSCALLDFMHVLVGDRKDISLIAITIKKNVHPEALENAKKVTKAHGIPWFAIREDQIDVKTEESFGSDTTNQSPFLRQVSIESRLVIIAEHLKIDALALGYTVEDHAEWVLWNAISGNATRKPGNATGNRMRVRIIRPFKHIPRQELELYTRLFLDQVHEEVTTEGNNHMCDPVSITLAQFYRRHPGAPYALVNNGEQIKRFRDQDLT
jgi:tRNA(Ile)-lysidine synthase TilS/MesJ